MKFASCPEQEVPAPDQLPALPRHNTSVRSPLASRQWDRDLPATSLIRATCSLSPLTLCQWDDDLKAKQ